MEYGLTHAEALWLGLLARVLYPLDESVQHGLNGLALQSLHLCRKFFLQRGCFLKLALRDEQLLRLFWHQACPRASWKLVGPHQLFVRLACQLPVLLHCVLHYRILLSDAEDPCWWTDELGVRAQALVVQAANLDTRIARVGPCWRSAHGLGRSASRVAVFHKAVPEACTVLSCAAVVTGVDAVTVAQHRALCGLHVA
jgi:hypothetical protein